MHFYAFITRTELFMRFEAANPSNTVTPKRHMQLRVKDLSRVPMWRLERDSNPRPFGGKASNLPISHHVPHVRCLSLWYRTFTPSHPSHIYPPGHIPRISVPRHIPHTRTIPMWRKSKFDIVKLAFNVLLKAEDF